MRGLTLVKWLLIFILAFGLILGAVIGLNYSQPFLNTQFAPEFNVRKWKAIKPGMTREEVETRIGQPLEVYMQYMPERWHYGEQILIEEKRGGIFTEEIVYSLPRHTASVTFGHDGLASNIHNTMFDQSPLLNATHAEVRKVWGEPVTIDVASTVTTSLYSKNKNPKSDVYWVYDVKFDEMNRVISAEMWWMD